MKFAFLPPKLFDDLKNSNLLLDTCVFIDANSRPRDFTSFFNKLRSLSCVLVTVFPVVIEFSRGSPYLEEFNKRQKFIQEIVEAVLPIDPTSIEEVERLVKTYRHLGQNTSVADFFLAGTLKRYKSVLLMTRNNKDFPVSLFERIGVITSDVRSEPQFYGIYKFSEKKYAEVIGKLLGIKRKRKTKKTKG